MPSLCAFISGLYLTKQMRRYGAISLPLRCVLRQTVREISMENPFGLVHYCNFLLPHWGNNAGLQSSAHKGGVRALENWFDDVCVVTGLLTSCLFSQQGGEEWCIWSCQLCPKNAYKSAHQGKRKATKERIQVARSLKQILILIYEYNKSSSHITWHHDKSSIVILICLWCEDNLADRMSFAMLFSTITTTQKGR